MGIVRVVTLGIIIWLVWFIIKRLRMKRLEYIARQSAEPAPVPVRSMRQCKFCGVHILESEAFSGSGFYFCDKNHHGKYQLLNSK